MTRYTNALLAAVLVAGGVAAGTVAAQSDEATSGARPVAADAEFEAFGQPVADAPGDPLAAAGIASLYVPVAPYRVIDTRDFGEDGRLFSVFGPDGNPTALNVLLDQDGIAAIPSDATAITYNVTIAEQVSGGYLTIADVSVPVADAALNSTINWTGPGGAVANGSAVKLGSFDGSPGYVGVLVGGGPDTSTQFILDVTGYYIAPPEVAG